MKELLLLRHAKSSWEWPVNDKDRPLQPKGMKAIAAVAQYWRDVFLSFEYIFTSPANRAMHTAMILAQEINFPLDKFQIDKRLYSFDKYEIINFVRQLDNRVHKLILVGHNPAISAAARYFSVLSFSELKTADWVHLRFNQNEWAHISDATIVLGTKKEALSR